MSRRKVNWDKVYDEIDESNKKNYNQNDGYTENLFKPQLKEDGTYQAIIRFLLRPEDDGSGVPYVKLMHHGFKGVGGWFIENCPTTIGENCPVCKSNSDNWETDEKTSRDRGRRTSYFNNILVVTDPQKKDNEGKVFIFKFGKTIYDKIMEKIRPPADSLIEKVDVFDYEVGMNFRLHIKPKKSGNQTYNDYSSSEFVGHVVPVGDEKQIEQIEENLFNLGMIVEKDKFKSYDDLKSLFLSKIGENKPSTSMNPSNKPVSQESESDGTKDVSEKAPADFFTDLGDDE